MRTKNARCRPHLFCVLFHHPTRGALLGSVIVSASSRGKWSTEWDVGTIDKDPQLSDHWFCRDQYEQKFEELLKFALAHANSPGFEIPCATLRWGSAKGMRKQLALDLANRLFALWQGILVDWDGLDPGPSI